MARDWLWRCWYRCSWGDKDNRCKYCICKLPVYLAYMALNHPPHGGRQSWRQNISYPKYIQECLGDNPGMLTPSQIAMLAMDRTMWRKVVVDCSADESWWWWNFNTQCHVVDKKTTNTVVKTRSAIKLLSICRPPQCMLSLKNGTVTWQNSVYAREI